jgi:PKD repeat protein
MKRLLLLFAVILSSVVAQAQCSASLSIAQVPNGNDLLNVNFTNTSSYGTPFTGQLKRYKIDFGDGTSIPYQYSPTLTHKYAAPGAYGIKLWIYSFDSSTMSNVCSDSLTTTAHVNYPPCGTVISVSGYRANQTFTATNPAGTSGISYSWNFGDGNTGTGSPVTHTYAASGYYTVTCTSTASGCTYTNTMNVQVLLPPPALICSTLAANFTSTVSSGGSQVTFTNTSSTVSSQYVVYGYWDFGDGSSTVQNGGNVGHTYSATGTFNVKLRMVWTDTFGVSKCTDSITKSVTITSVSPASIYGEINYDATIYGLPSFKVWLIQFDAATNILSAVDSQVVTGSTNFLPQYLFTNKPAGNYLVKTYVVGGPTSGTGLMPTYSDSSLLWSTANSVFAAPGSTVWARIRPLSGTLTAGPGFVAGNVSLGANKGAGAGVEGMLLFLRNSKNIAIQMTTTDANGDYSFSNIPAGTYTVYPELMNYATTSASVIVGSSSTPVTGINFHQDDTKMNIAPSYLAVPAAYATSKMVLYPNPTQDAIHFMGDVKDVKAYRIVDFTGRIVLQGNFKNEKIDVSSLTPGVYTVLIERSFGESSALRFIRR